MSLPNTCSLNLGDSEVVFIPPPFPFSATAVEQMVFDKTGHLISERTVHIPRRAATTRTAVTVMRLVQVRRAVGDGHVGDSPVPAGRKRQLDAELAEVVTSFAQVLA